MFMNTNTLLSLFFLCVSSIVAQHVTDPLPYAAIANPLPDTMDQLYRDSINIKFSPIRINQAGYRPQDKKFFYFTGSGVSTFTVIDASGKTVGNGVLRSTGQTSSSQLKIRASNNATLVSGGDTRYTMNSQVFSGPLFEGEIPDLAPGVYRVVVGSTTSHPFVIDERVYSWVRDALLKFYGVNRCGDSQSWFHKACHLNDPVVGGWHDCGDHLKEGLTMGYTASVLGLCAAVFEDRDADNYSANQGITAITDGIPDILYEAKHGADFILNSYDKAGGQVAEMITSVGNFGHDHMWWGRPEFQDKMPVGRGGPPREARNEVGANILGDYAANVAFVSRMIRPYDAVYADRCLKAAKDIYLYAKANSDKASSSPAYSGNSITNDKLALAAVALIWATEDKSYLNDLCFDKSIGTKGQSTFPKFSFEGGWFAHVNPLFSHGTANSDWASRHMYALWGFFRLVLLNEPLCATIGLNANQRKILIEKTAYSISMNLCAVSLGDQSITLPENSGWVPSTVKYSLPWMEMHTQMEWVWNRYQAGNITDMYCYYDVAQRIQGMELPNTPASVDWKAANVKEILIRQMDYMLGVNPWDISMVYGVGDKNFNHPHHRAANPEGKNVPGAFYKYVPPVGALQGSCKPSELNVYPEHFDNYHRSETGIDGTTSLFLPTVGLARQDTIGPPTGNVRIVYVGCDKAIVEVRQSRYGNASLRYGKGTAIDKTVNSDSSGVFHRFVLSGLAEGTLYNFDVVVRDLFGRESTLKNINEDRQEINFTFTTLQNCPSDANIENVKVCRVTHDSAEIFWYTPNGEFDSKVTFGDKIPPTSVQDGDISGHPVKFHYVKIGGLKEKTKYYFYVESGTSKDDNNGQLYTFTTPVEHVNFDVRAVRYTWEGMPTIGLNIINQDIKSYDSLEMRLYVRGPETYTLKAGTFGRTSDTAISFQDHVMFRVDIGIKYRSDGYQDKHFKTELDKFVQGARPVRIEDTYDAATNTWGYYIPVPMGGAVMESGARFRIDISILARSPYYPYLDAWTSPSLKEITYADWSFGPHSKADGEPYDYAGVPIMTKESVDSENFNTPINYYITVYRKNEYVWGYSPSKAELATKKTHFALSTQITSPINNPSADYYLYEGSGKNVIVHGHATITPVDGRINDIWVNGVRQTNPSSLVSWNAAQQHYNFSIPVPVKNGRNLVDVTLFAGPGQDCQECYGCAVTNHSFFVEAPFIQQYPSQLAILDVNFNTISDTVKIDTTLFHVAVTDKNGNRNKKGKDTVWISIQNLTNGDSITVRLIETADSSNTFQTVLPISVVSLPPAQTGNDKISMSGAEKVIVRYIDPTDETDTSQAFLYSRADFPTPLYGWIKDSNGDGSIDQMVVQFSQSLNDTPDSIQFSFPTASSNRVLKKGTDNFTTIDNNKLAILFSSPIEKITGFSSGLSGSGTSFTVSNNIVKSIKFVVKDSAGPVLIDTAVLNEREGSGDDTLTITFSETVSLSALTGDVLLLRKDGSDSPVNVVEIMSMISGLNRLTLKVRSSRPISEGDSVLINPQGALDDLSGNRAHAQNRPVPVTIKSAPPQIISACYRDLNADGKIDRVEVELTKTIVTQSCSFTFSWKSNDGLIVDASQASLSAGNSKIVHINVEGLITKDEIVTGGLMRIKINNERFGETPYQTVNDSAAPVIVSALFQKSLQPQSDTLQIVFSEPVQAVPENAFLLYNVNSNTPYDFECKERSGSTNSNNRVFIITTIRGVEYPAKNDSIWLHFEAGVKDFNGNIQNNSLNKRALLKIGQLPLNIKLYSGPNPFTPGISLFKSDNDLPETLHGKKGFLIKIDVASGAMGGDMTSSIKGKVTILDGTGSIVYTGAFQRGKSNESNQYYFYWDGTNSNKRITGTGTYVAYVETESVSDNVDQGTQKRTDIIKIGVNRNKIE